MIEKMKDRIKERYNKMGDRAVITTKNKDVGVYLHWNGTMDFVEGFLAYCDLKEYRSPEVDDYGWARLCQVIGNYFGGKLSIGVDRYEKLDTDNYDNGVYIIENWEIIGREYQHYKDYHQDNMDEFLLEINRRMPKHEQVPSYEIFNYAKKWNEKHLKEEKDTEEGDLNNDR